VIGRGQRRVRVALPWLEAALGAATAEGRAPARAPAAEWLVVRGTASPVSGPSWREWLLARTDGGADLLRRFPAGPCLRALHAGQRPEGTWACARPVHLLTAIDHLQLAPGGMDIGADESSALLEDVNRHFQGRGLRFHAAGPTGDWQLECADPVDCGSVHPEDAAGRNLRALMPDGRDRARVCSLMNEIQMLLHEHPVNLERAARRLPAINSLWLWGFGRLGAASAENLPTLYTEDAWLAGVWRLHGAASRSLEEFAAAVPSIAGEVLVAWSRRLDGETDEALAEAERGLFAPARTALRSGAVHAVDMLLGGRAFETDRSARLRFWRRGKPLAEALA